MAIDWDLPLQQRQGSRRRLGGLDVFFDFDWKDVFQHNRSAFPNGQSLADLVARECPLGKTPTLLLTRKTDVEPSILQTDDRHVVIVPIRDYLAQAGADAASTYYARLSGARLTQLSALVEADFTPVELGHFLDHQLDGAALVRWAEASPANVTILREVLSAVAAAPVGIAQLLQGLTSLQPEEIEAIAARIQALAGHGGLRHLLETVTESATGREATAEVLGERLEERIADARRQLAEYKELIGGVTVTETDVQRFLEQHPWIVGLTYVRARPRVEIPRGALDFVLDRYDGFLDFLELKGPGEQIVVESRDADGRPPSASAYSLGPGLSKALAQTHLYRANLDDTRGLAAQYGLNDTRQARIMIVLGRSTDLSPNAKEILRQLNLSLHRVEVIPYDLLGERTEGWLRSIEHLLAERAVVAPETAGVQ